MNPFTGVKGIPIWGTAKAAACLDVGEYPLWPECGVDGSSGSRGLRQQDEAGKARGL